MNICHCSMCRKVTGSAYGVFAHIRSDRFRWTAGVENVAEYPSSPGHVRAFCRTCGSSVPTVKADYTCIPAGAFDVDPLVKPTLQIFAGSKAPWHVIASQPVAYDEFDPD
ncbi:MAG TPA: GFA family protein [Pseudomonadales bacterium]